MVAINNLNMLTVMSAMQQTQNFITIIDSEKEYEDMSGSMLDQYVGRFSPDPPTFVMFKEQK